MEGSSCDEEADQKLRLHPILRASMKNAMDIHEHLSSHKPVTERAANLAQALKARWDFNRYMMVVRPATTCYFMAKWTHDGKLKAR